MNGAKLKISEPVVSFCETVTTESDKMCLAKSPNKHNRIFMKAEPLHDDLPDAIETKKFDIKEEAKKRGKVLADVSCLLFFLFLYFSISLLNI